MVEKTDYLPVLNKNYTDSKIYKRFLLWTNFKFNGKKILDYWCWNWKLFEFLLQNWANNQDLFGVDIEQSHLNYIKENVWISNLSLVNIDTQWTICKSDFFDIIFCLDVIEHSEKPALILKELKRLIKPGGVIILCTPNRWTRHIDRKLLKSCKIFDIIKFNIQRFNWKAFLDPTHLHEYTPNEFKGLLKKHNFIVIKNNFSLINYIPFFSTKSFIVHLNK